MKLYPLFYFFIFLSSCAIQHNFPHSTSPNKTVPPQTTIAFVDQNGSFYPDGWRKIYGKPPANGRKNAFSLSKIAAEKGIENNLHDFENSYLTKLGKHLNTKKRVIILVHGYNAEEQEITEDYERIQHKLDLNSSDEVVQFYWDGLYTRNLFSGMKIWFDASDYSQYAGKFGLRKILNTLSKKDVYIISHSRGASVVLSAISSAALDSVKMADVVAHHYIDSAKSNNILYNRNNKITFIALAPAIGKANFETKAIEKFSAGRIVFTPQLKVMHITTNGNDLMLKKVMGALSDKLVPTDLGFKPDYFGELSRAYPFMKRSDFSGQKSHEFTRYIQNPKFDQLLEIYKLKR